MIITDMRECRRIAEDMGISCKTAKSFIELMRRIYPLDRLVEFCMEARGYISDVDQSIAFAKFAEHVFEFEDRSKYSEYLEFIRDVKQRSKSWVGCTLETDEVIVFQLQKNTMKWSLNWRCMLLDTHKETKVYRMRVPKDDILYMDNGLEIAIVYTEDHEIEEFILDDAMNIRRV